MVDITFASLNKGGQQNEGLLGPGALSTVQQHADDFVSPTYVAL